MTTRVRCTNMFHFDAKNRHIYMYESHTFGSCCDESENNNISLDSCSGSVRIRKQHSLAHELLHAENVFGCTSPVQRAPMYTVRRWQRRKRKQINFNFISVSFKLKIYEKLSFSPFPLSGSSYFIFILCFAQRSEHPPLFVYVTLWIPKIQLWKRIIRRVRVFFPRLPSNSLKCLLSCLAQLRSFFQYFWSKTYGN